MPLTDSPLSVLQVASARNLNFGAMKSMLNLSRGLQSLGHRVEFLTFEGRGGGTALRALGETVHEVRVRLKIDPIAIVRMANEIRQSKVDVVHTHLSTSSINGTLAARLAKVPSVATVHGLSGRLSFVFATHLIAVSEQVKEHLVKQGTSSSRISVVYNGIDFNLPDASEVQKMKKQLALSHRFPIIGTSARLTKLKGVRDGITAFSMVKRKYNDAAYLIIGSGEEESASKSFANELGIADSVYFLGYQENVALYLALLDLFLFPSLKEAMGMALAEASLLGVPSVTTDVGGIPEVILREWGTLVPPGHPEILAERLIMLAEDPEARRKIGELARRRSQELFTVEEMTNRTLAVYKLAMSYPPNESQAIVK